MAKKHKKQFRRILPNGRNENRKEQFVKLPHSILFSGAYRALSPNARSLLVELVSIFNGANNGSIYLSVRDAAARLGVVDTAAASKAFDELEELGFIALTKDSFFSIKAADSSRARAWRLTWHHCDKVGATRDFEKREPLPCTRERRRMDRGLRALKAFRKHQSYGNFPVLDSSTFGSLLADPHIDPVREFDTDSAASL